MNEVDKYGVPIRVFGDGTSPEFFEVLGRILAINGRIEYLKDRLDHLPSSETSVVRKVEQFRRRYDSGRAIRNAIVHSSWAFGAHKTDPEVILGIRYKIRKAVSGQTARVSLHDIPDSEREQDIVEYRLEELRKLVRHDVATMYVGELAYAEVMLNWASR